MLRGFTLPLQVGPRPGTKTCLLGQGRHPRSELRQVAIPTGHVCGGWVTERWSHHEASRDKSLVLFQQSSFHCHLQEGAALPVFKSQPKCLLAELMSSLYNIIRLIFVAHIKFISSSSCWGFHQVSGPHHISV